MKALRGLLRRTSPAAEPGEESGFFSTAFADPSQSGGVIDWPTRAADVQALPLTASEQQQAVQQLQDLWRQDRHMASLPAVALERLPPFLHWVSLPANQVLIGQHEHSDFLVITLQGSLAVDRQQPWGEQLRLAETRPGDVLGEMSLLDAGPRFSQCSTLQPSALAVLTAAALDRMMEQDAALAAHLLACLARKLSRQLRIVSARLGDSPP